MNRVLIAVVASVFLLQSAAHAQSSRYPNRASPRGVGARPGGGGIFGRTFAPRRTAPNPLGRSRLLLQRYGFIGPLHGYSGPSAMPRMIPGITNYQTTATPEPKPPIKLTGRTDYALRMARRHEAVRRRMSADGWVYFHEGDYGRAFSTFGAAEVLNRGDLVPLFGQLFSAVAQQQYSRSLHKLARLTTLDRIRGAVGLGLFEHNVSLRQAFSSEEELLTVFGRLRGFVQANPDVPAVQALYCLMLWYVRAPDAVLEAKSVAARIARTHPTSLWASFDAKIIAAERNLRDAAAADPAPTDTSQPAPPSG